MLLAMLWPSVIVHPWGSTVPVEAHLGAFLDEDWQNTSLVEILKASVSALQGVSEGDADLLKQAFNTKQLVT